MPQRRYRYSWDDVTHFDADYMAGWGAFTPDCHEVMDYTDQGRPNVTFHMHATRDEFSAVYLWPDKEGARTVRSTVYLRRQPCRFGGTRVYFIAPCCVRNVRRLAVLPHGLMCGACGGVTWQSRRERPIFRLMRKANKIADRLGCDSWEQLPKERPKHMRQATFEVLKAQRDILVRDINHRIGMKLMPTLLRMERRHGTRFL